MSAPPDHELECGHCGSVFVSDGPLGSRVRCPVCGGECVVTPPRPKPPPPPPPPYFEPIPLPKPVVPDPAPTFEKMDPEERARRLAAPWAKVHRGLHMARVGTLLAAALCVPLLCLGNPVEVAVERRAREMWWLLMAVHLVPLLVHAAGQFLCMRAPESHGQQSAGASFVLLALGCVFGVIAILVHRGEAAPIALAFVVTSFAALVFWLVFVTQLGIRLRDRTLADAARSFTLWFGLSSLPLLLVCLGCCPQGFARLAGSAGVFYLLWRYASLLGLAAHVVATRAPVAPDT